MEKINAKKDDVLKKLKENRLKHVEQFKEAIRGYRIKCAELLDKQLGKIEAGEEFHMSELTSTPKPVSYEKEYDLAIEMLEMDISDTVELNREQFSHYIRDDWSWKATFTYYNSGYKGYSGYSGYSGRSGYTEVKFSSTEV